MPAPTHEALKNLKTWAGHRFADPRWLELVASVHFLMVSRVNAAARRQAIHRKISDIKASEIAAAESEVLRNLSVPS